MTPRPHHLMPLPSHRTLFCNCTHAQVLPPEVKTAVLRHLCDSGIAFDAVADLCELSARQDPALHDLAEGGPLKIAACFPRAVKWLFASANAPLDPHSTEVLNLRTQGIDEILAALDRTGIQPNLPAGKPTAADAPSAAGPTVPTPLTPA